MCPPLCGGVRSAVAPCGTFSFRFQHLGVLPVPALLRTTVGIRRHGPSPCQPHVLLQGPIGSPTLGSELDWRAQLLKHLTLILSGIPSQRALPVRCRFRRDHGVGHRGQRLPGMCSRSGQRCAAAEAQGTASSNYPTHVNRDPPPSSSLAVSEQSRLIHQDYVAASEATKERADATAAELEAVKINHGASPPNNDLPIFRKQHPLVSLGCLRSPPLPFAGLPHICIVCVLTGWCRTGRVGP